MSSPASAELAPGGRSRSRRARTANIVTARPSLLRTRPRSCRPASTTTSSCGVRHGSTILPPAAVAGAADVQLVGSRREVIERDTPVRAGAAVPVGTALRECVQGGLGGSDRLTLGVAHAGDERAPGRERERRQRERFARGAA
jgi:hypothetical protein